MKNKGQGTREMYASLHYVLQNVIAKTAGEERFSVLKVPPQGPIDYLYIDPVGVVQIDNVKKTTEHTSEILINPDIKLLAELITKLQKAMTDTSRPKHSHAIRDHVQVSEYMDPGARGIRDQFCLWLKPQLTRGHRGAKPINRVTTNWERQEQES